MRHETQDFRDFFGLDEVDNIVEMGKLVALKAAIKREEKEYATKKLQNSRRDNKDLSE